MKQLLTLWGNLDAQRRVVVVFATIAVFVGVLALSRMAAQDDMKLLYSGLAPESAGEVIGALEGQGIAYQVRGNSIYVPQGARDRLRLSLASQGLPASGGAGYELLDQMTGFGTTSQMFDVAYLRAKEGELARTIVANPQIKEARVHIAASEKSPFRQSSDPTASVSLKSSGTGITREAAESIRHLVASAVAGLKASDVSIIDASLGTVISGDTSETPNALEMNREATLKQNVLRLVEARTGAGGAVVEVNIDTVSEQEMILERRVDPESRIAISTDTQQTTRSSTNNGGSGVTVASNLPDGDAGAGNGEASENGNESREVINYEVSETTREITRVPGAIARVSVAVLVDGTTQIGDDGQEVWQPRDEAELAVLTDLVKSAVGFNEARGDTVTIRSMDLQPISPTVVPEGQGWVTASMFDPTTLIKPGITALVVLALGLFVLRPVLLAGRTPNLVDAPALIENSAVGSADLPDLGIDPITPAIAPPMGGLPELPMATPDFSMATAADPMGMNSPMQFDEDPVERLKNLIEERQDETVEVLRTWIETPEETA